MCVCVLFFYSCLLFSIMLNRQMRTLGEALENVMYMSNVFKVFMQFPPQTIYPLAYKLAYNNDVCSINLCKPPLLNKLSTS